MNNRSLVRLYQFLRITYTLYWGIIGLDKFFGIVTESHLRVSQLTLSLLPFNLAQLLQIVGVLELLIALLIWFKPRLGTLCGIVMMAAIVINLIAMGQHYDIAIHGATIGLGMVAFYDLCRILGR